MKIKLIQTVTLSIVIFSFISCKKEIEKNINNDSNIILKENTKTSPEFPKLSKKEETNLRNQARDFYLSKIKVNGYTGSFLVAKNGQIIYEDYSGFANKKENTAITENTSLHVASVGKVITAITILKLVDLKVLELDKPVSNYIKGFPHQKITIRTLLNHRSGLRYYGYYSGIWNNIDPIANKDVINIIKDQKVTLDFEPNTRFAYSNTNYVVLASIVEEVTKKSFSQAVDELIFKPLKMDNSFVFDNLENKALVTQSYKSNFKLMHWDYMDATYGDKNIYTTPRDFLKLDNALYSDTFLTKEVKEEMTKGYSFEYKGIKNYGLGFRLIQKEDGTNITYHNGWWRGNTSSYIRLAKENVCIILFSNKYSKLTYKVSELSKFFGKYNIDDIDL